MVDKFLLYFGDRVSLCSPALYVAQAGLKLVILLPQPPKCWDYRQVLPCLVIKYFSKKQSLINLQPPMNVTVYFNKSPYYFSLTVFASRGSKKKKDSIIKS
jgi:hypothetical protein